MAHSKEKKAQAWALLLTGHTVAQTAEATGVPKQTVSRWKNEDADRIMPDLLRASPALRAVAASLRRLHGMR